LGFVFLIYPQLLINCELDKNLLLLPKPLKAIFFEKYFYYGKGFFDLIKKPIDCFPQSIVNTVNTFLNS